MLEDQVLRGLVMEWTTAESFLPKAYRGLMKKPGFELRDFERIWGMWEGAKTNIILARRLVHGHSWKSVREVLLHEMAHQMTDEAFGGDESPHGPRFRQACQLLGADPAASGAFPSIYERMACDGLENDDRIMSRVRKLLAMAHSANKNEAEVAMAKAHGHILRYNIDLAGKEKGLAYCSMCVGEPAMRQSADKYVMAALLRDYYFVESVWVQMFVPQDGKRGRALEISGARENVKMAEYVHSFLNRAIVEQWASYESRTPTRRMQKTDFALGLIEGFREKLKAQNKAIKYAESRSFALTKVGDKLLKIYLKKRYPHLRRIGQRGRAIDENARNAGRKAGRSTVLRKAVEARSARAIRMLTA